MAMVLTSPFCVVSGGPGTGKSTILREVARRSEDEVLFLGKTGSAAYVIANSVGEEETVLTIDLLFTKVALLLRFGGGVIVVDEASMLDLVSLFELLSVLQPRRIALVGDFRQLEPVGADGVLEDLVKCSQIPRVLLTKVFRQTEGTGLYKAIALLTREGVIKYSELAALADESFAVESKAGWEKRVATLCAGGDRPQVIVMTNAARTTLNTAIQGVANPRGRPLLGLLRHVRLGDHRQRLRGRQAACDERSHRGGEGDGRRSDGVLRRRVRRPLRL